VPIVIHNAVDVAPKGEFVYRSGTVHIDVLPPVETRTWKKQSIDKHMADIRQQFLTTLGHADG
jgi:putative phosphoserine phosphatase/1-acylglycerol-3-phosphate O-acyltransferase